MPHYLGRHPVWSIVGLIFIQCIIRFSNSGPLYGDPWFYFRCKIVSQYVYSLLNIRWQLRFDSRYYVGSATVETFDIYIRFSWIPLSDQLPRPYSRTAIWARRSDSLTPKSGAIGFGYRLCVRDHYGRCFSTVCEKVIHRRYIRVRHPINFFTSAEAESALLLSFSFPRSKPSSQ